MYLTERRKFLLRTHFFLIYRRLLNGIVQESSTSAHPGRTHLQKEGDQQQRRSC